MKININVDDIYPWLEEGEEEVWRRRRRTSKSLQQNLIKNVETRSKNLDYFRRNIQKERKVSKKEILIQFFLNWCKMSLKYIFFVKILDLFS